MGMVIGKQTTIGHNVTHILLKYNNHWHRVKRDTRTVQVKAVELVR